MLLCHVIGTIGAPVNVDCREDSCGSSLEDLAYKHHTDKARDDHSYVSAYAMLFDSIRHKVRNVTEIGVLYGRSLPVWHDYFPFADLWGLDVKLHDHAKATAAALGPRVHLLAANSQEAISPQNGRPNLEQLGLIPGSMDIVIDDGDHSSKANAKTLSIMWPLVKPGGYYIIEDIATGGNAKGHYATRKGMLKLQSSGHAWMAHNGTHWPSHMRDIYEQNDVFFADTLVGHRDFSGFLKAMGGWMKDRVDHNSHLLVIRRRMTPRTRPVTSFYKGLGAHGSFVRRASVNKTDALTVV